jgi:hypothetical protein
MVTALRDRDRREVRWTIVSRQDSVSGVGEEVGSSHGSRLRT